MHEVKLKFRVGDVAYTVNPFGDVFENVVSYIRIDSSGTHFMFVNGTRVVGEDECYKTKQEAMTAYYRGKEQELLNQLSMLREEMKYNGVKIEC